ncbi:MAG: ATP-binding cassette domain-containing protein [Acidobacteria bacterium]|nr:ATP-binding cassette domain-containing protein [Acidobacteriota bacterium]
MRIEGLFFSYEKHRVFHDFAFSPKTRLVALTGPPGCGKTTLLKLLTRNLKAQRSAVFDIAGDSLLILQEDALLPWLTGTDNIRVFTQMPTGTSSAIDCTRSYRHS